MTTSETPAKPVAKKPAARSAAAKPAAKPVAAKPVAAKPVVKPAAAEPEVKPAVAAAVAPAPAAAAPAPAPVTPAPVVVDVVAPEVKPVVSAPAPAPAPVVSAPAIAALTLPPGLEEVGAKAQAAALKSYEEVSSVAKDALDAVVASSEVLSAGLQKLGSTVYDLTQQSIDDGVAATKQILAAKTVREFVDLQSSLAKSQFDRLLTEAPRLGDLSVKMVEEAVAPLSAKVKAVIDKLIKPAA